MSLFTLNNKCDSVFACVNMDLVTQQPLAAGRGQMALQECLVLCEVLQLMV